MWKRLLVPHDFSQCAARATELAAQIAEREQAELTLLHVSPLPPNLPRGAKIAASEGSGAESVSVADMVTAGACRDLAALAEPLRQRGIAVQTFARATEPGSPADAILRIAGELGADVIVVGTHGRTGLAHMLLGSVAEKIIRGANIPVITVRSRDHEPRLTHEETRAEDELQG